MCRPPCVLLFICSCFGIRSGPLWFEFVDDGHCWRNNLGFHYSPLVWTAVTLVYLYWCLLVYLMANASGLPTLNWCFSFIVYMMANASGLLILSWCMLQASLRRAFDVWCGYGRRCNMPSRRSGWYFHFALDLLTNGASSFSVTLSVLRFATGDIYSM